MNGDGGCCIANYQGGGEGIMFGMSKVDRIMLKFRPIAPKPMANGSGSGSGGSTTDNSDGGYVKCGRSKRRRYVRVKKNKNDSFKKRKVKAKVSSREVVTLPLLPETPDRKENKPVTGFSDLLSPVYNNNSNSNSNSSMSDNKKLSTPAQVWLSFNNRVEHVSVRPVVTKPLTRVPRVVSYVTVECVTDTWVDWEVLGCTDEEIVMNLDNDTCPGFISDDQDKVVWTNKAYRQMAEVEHDDDGIAVVLILKDRWTRSPVTYRAFTCKVRVMFAGYCRQQRTSPLSHTLTLPCDVWRMQHGGCAWRLDVKAALSLGR